VPTASRVPSVCADSARLSRVGAARETTASQIMMRVVK